MATSLTLEGRISAKLAPQSGQSARGAWARQDFILEFPDGNFTSNACFTAWGQDKVAELDKFRVGDAVKVSFNVRAREYSGRWYNDLRIWRIAPAGADEQPAAAPGFSAPAPSAPADGFGPAAPAYSAPAGPAPAAPAPTLDDMPADFQEEDLPF